ncbi:peptidase S10 serine carboxypeptidase, partial [mine drainage metagenome]
DLRVTGPEFEQTLLLPRGETSGRLDARFSGPTMDPLAESAAYDPQSAAISSAYTAAFNDYVRKTLKFGGKHITRSSPTPWATTGTCCTRRLDRPRRPISPPT